MSRRQAHRSNLKLPHRLQQELGLSSASSSRKQGQRPSSSVVTRKAKRKADRLNQKAARTNPRQDYRKDKEGREKEAAGSSKDGAEDDIDTPRDQNALPKRQIISNPAERKPKSILKQPLLQPDVETSDSETSSRASSPGLVLDSSSRNFKERQEQDEAEIAALEKKLGLKGKGITQAFVDDGLEDLLEALDSGDEKKKRKREASDWLERKRQKPSPTVNGVDNIRDDGRHMMESEEDSEESDLEGSDSTDEAFVSTDEVFRVSKKSTEEDGFAGFDSDSSNEQLTPPPKIRENPYVAPSTSTTSTVKYIPPSLRARSADDQSLGRLRRQIQGHLNKLSEANLVSILTEIEKLYQSNPRQDITSNLIDLLLLPFCDRSSVQSTFAILHAAFIAGIYKVIGTDFGAEVLSRLVERLERYHAELSASSGKEAVNLIALLSHLFSFHVVNSTILFDYIRLFLEDLSEPNTELMLKLVKECGPQLRQDDAASLKTMVPIMQNAAAKMAAGGKDMSVRTKFMMETIIDLKNNKMKTATNFSGMAGDHITQMRKVLGSLNSRNLRASDPLRVSREDIMNSDKKGKWWLVGASWKGNDHKDADTSEGPSGFEGVEEDINIGEPDLLALARQYRMNTDVRRSIFIAIMSAADYKDAHVRLTKLRLKRSQESELPRVLLRCAGAEAVYNPYYTLIAKKLCSEKKMKMSFQFVLWDFLKRMGEGGGNADSDDDQEGEDVELAEIVNVAKMFAALIAEGLLTLGVLKTLNLLYLKEQAKTFVEVLLVVILTQRGPNPKKDGHDDQIMKVFGRAADTPQLIKALQYFIKKHLRHSDLVAKEENAQLKHGCRVALETLELISRSNSVAAS